MKKAKQKFIKKITLSLLSIMLGLLALVQPIKVEPVNSFEPDKILFCDIFGTPESRAFFKAAKTEWIPFLIASKSSTSGVDNAKENIYNSILTLAGYKIGIDSPTTPFEQFGLAGLNFTSYTGEWKYYDVDPCDDSDRQIPKSTNYGEFYEGRRDPLSTYEERFSTVDVRTKEYARGRMSAFWKALRDNFNNLFVSLAKWIVALTLALISLALSDFSSLIGFSDDVQISYFMKFYTGLFLPLVSVFFLATAIYLIYYGLYKKEYRTALIGGIIKPLICYFGAVLIAVNPILITYPNKISVLLQSVVVSGLTEYISGDGEHSLCPQEVLPSDFEPTNKKFLENSSQYMKQVIGCRIWSEYLFKPFVRGQFGTDYKDLESLANENERWVGTPTIHYGKNNTITNWGLFHLSVMSGTHKPLDGEDIYYIGDINKDYYRIVDALSNYDEDIISGTGEGMGGSFAGGVPSANAKEFFEKYGEFAKKVADEAGIYASVMLAQAALESGYGRHLAAPYNFFGIKCGIGFPCKEGVTTQEERNGKLVTIKDGFRAFESEEDGLAGYARFLHGQGAGADFSGGFKKNASTPYEAISNIIGAGYATDSSYVGKIMNIIETYDLTQYDTPNKDGTNLAKYRNKNTNGDGSGSKLGTSSGSEHDIPVPKDNPPLKEWDYWIGNQGGTRFSASLLMIVFSIVGSIGPIFLSLLSSTYSLGITLLMILSPIFLLFGCWGGKGNEILIRYLGTVAYTIVKRVGITFLLVLSIIIITNTFALINTVGPVKALLFLFILTFILIKQNQVILNKLADLNIPKFNTEGIGNSATKALDVASDVGMTGVGGIVGGIAAKKGGGSFLRGAKAGAFNIASQKSYKYDFGRRVQQVYTSTNQSQGNFSKKMLGHKCCICMDTINEGDMIYLDENHNFYCEICASARGYEGMTTSFVDNLDNEHTQATRDNEQVYIEDAHNNQEKVVKYFSMEEAVNAGVNDIMDNEMWENKKGFVKERIEDSMNILTKDLKIASDTQMPLDRPFVPDVLRSVIREDRIISLARQGKYKEVEEAMLDGWKRWYTLKSERANNNSKTAQKIVDSDEFAKKVGLELEAIKYNKL